MKTIGLLGKCLGIGGLNGLDQILQQKISHELKDVVRILKSDLTDENRRNIEMLAKQFKILTSFDENYDKTYK